MVVSSYILYLKFNLVMVRFNVLVGYTVTFKNVLHSITVGKYRYSYRISSFI